VEECSFVTEIIQHVKYSVLMARVAEIAQNGKTYVRYQSYHAEIP
jgi:hypothetical protein